MADFQHASSGGRYYTIETVNGGKIVRKNDGAFLSSGTRLGKVRDLTEALAVIKSDSGSKNVSLG